MDPLGTFTLLDGVDSVHGVFPAFNSADGGSVLFVSSSNLRITAMDVDDFAQTELAGVDVPTPTASGDSYRFRGVAMEDTFFSSCVP